METNVKVLNDSERELEVTLSYDEIKAEIDKAYKKEGKSISVPGFRKGKVPRQLLTKLYGDAIEYRASEDIANKKFWEIVKEKDLHPISTPQMTDLNFVRNEKLSFKVTFEVIPELELKDYKGLEIQKPVFKVKEKEILAEIEKLKKDNSVFEIAESVDGSNYKIEVNLQKLDTKGNPTDTPVSPNIALDLSDEKVNPAIPENAQGKKVGDKFRFSFTDEHKHGEEIHKEEFHYEAEITKIEKIVPPEENEEFFKRVSKNKASTFEELKSEITKDYEMYFKDQSEQTYLNNLLSKVVENNPFDVPKGYVENILLKLIEAEKENAKRYGYTDITDEQLKPELEPRAEWTAKWQIIHENLARIENIKVEDSDLEELAKKEAASTGISVDKLVKYYKDSNRTAGLLEEKVIEFLKVNNTVKEIDEEEFKKQNEEKAAYNDGPEKETKNEK